MDNIQSHFYMNLTDTASQPAIRSILMVDTDSLSCELLQFRFESEGFHSEIMTDGRKALQTDLSRFCLIIVDLMEQEFNGFEFTKSIRRNPETFNIPVIILTANASEDNIVDGLNAGADGSLFERFEIKHEAWDNESEVSDRAVDTNISRLRKKLGDYGRYLVNRQGFGYGLIE